MKKKRKINDGIRIGAGFSKLLENKMNKPFIQGLFYARTNTNTYQGRRAPLKALFCFHLTFWKLEHTRKVSTRNPALKNTCLFFSSPNMTR